MFSRTIMLSLCGLEIQCTLRHPATVRYLRDHTVEGGKGRAVASVGMGPEEERVIRKEYPPEERGAAAEIRVLTPLVSDSLLPYDRFLFHSAAVCLEGEAWLLAAPSGTGKTTQYRNMRGLVGERARMICGDHPVLHIPEEGEVTVHPSPWNGKEGYGSRTTAPLAGIILLEQAGYDRIRRLGKGEAALPVFYQVDTLLKTEDQVHRLFRLERRLLDRVPVWKFENTGTPGSTGLLLGHIERYRGTGNDGG